MAAGHSKISNRRHSLVGTDENDYCAALFFPGLLPDKPMAIVSYAQNHEDVLLWRALGHIRGGFYVDVGAQHPVVDSVSLWFYEQGWHGIHVEPVPEYAELLRQHRPDEIVLQAALAQRAGTIHFFEVPGTGLSTGDAAVAKTHNDAGFPVRETKVRTVSLASVFKLAGKKDIHWMKVDVEGMEAKVFEGWQASRTRPWVVLVESTMPNTQVENYAEWEQQLLSRDYEFAYFDGLNRYYVSGERRDLLASLRCGVNCFDRFTPIRERKLQTEILTLKSGGDALRQRAQRAESLLGMVLQEHPAAPQALQEEARQLMRLTLQSNDQLPPLSLGESRTISIVREGYSGCLLDGFYPPEDWGTWSNSRHSVIGIPIDNSVPDGASMNVTMTVRAFDGLLSESPVLTVSSGEGDLCYVLFRECGVNQQEISFEMCTVAPLTEIHLHLTNLASPAATSDSTDTRLLGFAILDLNVSVGRGGGDARTLRSPPLAVLGVDPAVRVVFGNTAG